MAGALLTVISVVLIFLVIPKFRKHGIPVDVYKETTTLVTSGIYRFHSESHVSHRSTDLYGDLAISFENSLVLSPTWPL